MLNPHKNTRPRRELLDFDYLDKLSKEELEWLAKYCYEEYMANPDPDAENSKEIYDANNARNRDIFNVFKRVGNNITEASPESLMELIQSGQNDSLTYENFLVELIDNQEKQSEEE